ncbi:hypothetical protein ACVWZR_002084 [Bradyrhizobium sp. i1.3.1]
MHSSRVLKPDFLDWRRVLAGIVCLVGGLRSFQGDETARPSHRRARRQQLFNRCSIWVGRRSAAQCSLVAVAHRRDDTVPSADITSKPRTISHPVTDHAAFLPRSLRCCRLLWRSRACRGPSGRRARRLSSPCGLQDTACPNDHRPDSLSISLFRFIRPGLTAIAPLPSGPSTILPPQVATLHPAPWAEAIDTAEWVIFAQRARVYARALERSRTGYECPKGRDPGSDLRGPTVLCHGARPIHLFTAGSSAGTCIRRCTSRSHLTRSRWSSSASSPR